MSLKGIWSRLFSLSKRPKIAAAAPQPIEKPAVSPYAKFLTGEPNESEAPAPPPGGIDRRTSNALVFLSAGERKPVAPRKPLRIKDAFLIDAAKLKSLPPSTVGLFFPAHGALLIRDPQRNKAGRLIRWRENAEHIPIFGDWTGSGTETLGFFDPKIAAFHLWFTEDKGEPDLNFLYGPAGLGWIPLVGDWDGDGKDGIGLYDPSSSSFLLRNELAGGEPDIFFMYGLPGAGWIPIAGDWDGDGKDGVAVYDPLSGTFLLRNELAGGNHDAYYRIAGAGPDWIPLAGDWDGDGADNVGIYDGANQAFYLCNQSAVSTTDMLFKFGPVGIQGFPFSMRWEDRPEAARAPEVK